MLLATPLARLVTGKSYGANATIISLTLAAAPFIARLVESSLLEVDKGVIEAAQSMGASIWQIVFKVLIGEARVPRLHWGLCLAILQCPVPSAAAA